jgi:hypothetical protein
MKIFKVWLVLLLGMSLVLSVGVAQADPEENSSRIQNLETRVDNLEIQGQNPDADTLDGFDSTDFALSGHNHAGNSSTQYLSFSFLGGTANCSEHVYNIWAPIDDVYMQFANADTSVGWMGRSSLYSGCYGCSCAVFIPVQLPDGADVVEFGMSYYDETVGDPAISASLMRNMDAPDVGDPGATLVKIKPPGGPHLPQYAWSPCVKGARCVIDNTRFGYHIKGNLWGGESMALISAFVGYKMP